MIFALIICSANCVSVYEVLPSFKIGKKIHFKQMKQETDHRDTQVENAFIV